MARQDTTKGAPTGAAMDYPVCYPVCTTTLDRTRQKTQLWLDKAMDSIMFFFFFLTLLLSSFWASRGHRCRPFFPPVLAFNFYRAQGSAIPLLVDFSSSVANSRSRAFRK